MRRFAVSSVLALAVSAVAPGFDASGQAPFLDDAQKRDILYNNAERFFRLGDAAR